MKCIIYKNKIIASLSIISALAGILLSGCDALANAGDVYVPANSVAPVSPEAVVQVQQAEESIVSLNSENVDQASFNEYYDNFLDFDIEEYTYEGYRIGADDNDTEEIFVLRARPDYDKVEALPGSIANVDPFDGITSLSISYESDSDFYILYGNDRNNLEYSYEMSASEKYVERKVDFVKDASYFRIEADENDLSVSSLEFVLNGEGVDETREHYVLGSRYIPATDYNPKEGEVLKAPICTVDDKGNVAVKEWKEYTYHSFDFVQNEVMVKGADAKEYALTDPMDVANYFVLFNRIPANFGVSTAKEYYKDTRIQGPTVNVDEVYEVFGRKYTRQVSEYSRDDGYATKVPARDNNKTKTGILYYEFDIDIDGKYTVRNRGMGRVVGFVGGFESNEDDTNVAVFTDDHYATFVEYSNCGLWNERFDAEMSCRTGRVYNFYEAEEILKLAN